MSSTVELKKTRSTSSDRKSGSFEVTAQALPTSSDDGISEKALLRKIDWRIMPIMMMCYSIQFLDKVLINFANVMGISQDTHLSVSQFNWLASAYSIAFIIGQYSAGLAMQKYPVDRVLSLMILLWGLSVLFTCVCNNFTALVVVRVFPGLFEGSVAPGLTIITSEWYTKSEAAARTGVWYCGAGVAQITGGLLSFGFQHVKSGFESWRIMFLVMGLVTMMIGVWTSLCLPRSPEHAKFLTQAERLHFAERAKANQTGTIEDRKVRWNQVAEFFLDPASWLLFLIALMAAISSGFVSFYSATVIKNMGYNGKQSALLSTPTGIVTIVSVMTASIAVGRKQPRGKWITIVLIPATLGACLLSFVPDNNHAGLLAGIYLINFVMPTLNLVYSWAGANFAGYTKRICINAAIMIAFGLGNIIGPQTFQARDAPKFMPAKYTVIVTDATGALLAIFMSWLYARRNASRDKAASNKAASLNKEVLNEIHDKNLTDFENRNFRYRL